MKHSYVTRGTCSRSIDIVTEGDRVVSVAFNGGCHGNTQGLAALVAGMPVDEVISRLHGIQCGTKGTSCPDQLAQALTQLREEGAV